MKMMTRIFVPVILLASCSLSFGFYGQKDVDRAGKAYGALAKDRGVQKATRDLASHKSMIKDYQKQMNMLDKQIAKAKEICKALEKSKHTKSLADDCMRKMKNPERTKKQLENKIKDLEAKIEKKEK